jgi:hypothetical protein
MIFADIPDLSGGIVTRVWLPDPPEVLGGLPEGMAADVWTGAHDPATAEWTVGAIVAHLRDFPRFITARNEGRCSRS